MDIADYKFSGIPEFDVKKFDREVSKACNKKRAADEGIDKDAGVTKRARVAGPVKIGREAAAKYWQSLIDAGKGLGVGTKEGKAGAATLISGTVNLEVRVNKTLILHGTSTASRPKGSPSTHTPPTLSRKAKEFKCTSCPKMFASNGALGQHSAAKHGPGQ